MKHFQNHNDKCSKISTTSLSRTGIHKMLVRIANRLLLIRACLVCLGLFGRQLESKF